ncbi:MAG TPA: helix-turn-helix transcriptional regulator [Gammaproteobacteria bacterium]|nr:helix-turn-helix transcriptional regulator [Gammaproteobacteria bacterium]
MQRFNRVTEFVTENCCTCGIQFAMTDAFHKRRLDDKKIFYCPSGHAQHYTGKSEEQRLREQLKQQQIRANVLTEEKDEISRTYNRMRRRVKEGKCPCCEKTFPNLFQHMRSQHPSFGNNELVKVLRLTFGLSQVAMEDEIGLSRTYISMYENGKRVPDRAVEKISQWLAVNAA